MKIVLGLFETDQLINAINQLRDDGFSYNDLTVISSAAELPDYVEGEPEESAVTGAVVGGATGGILAALGAWIAPNIPGFEAMVATGVLTTATGSVIGAYLGSIYSVRAESQEKIDYHESLESGQMLLVVQTTDEQAARAAELLEAAKGTSVQIHEVTPDDAS